MTDAAKRNAAPDDLLSLARALEVPAEAGPETVEDARVRERKLAQATENLTKNRLKALKTDADHRDEVLRVEGCENPSGRHDAFEEASYLYYMTADGKDKDGAPVFPLVRGATDNGIAYALSALPSCTLDCTPRHETRYWNPDILAFYEREAAENTRRLQKLVRADLERCGYNDLRVRVTSDAGIFGVGYLVVDDDTVLDSGDPDVAALLEDPEALMNEGSVALLNLLKSRARIRASDPRWVYWQAGVASPFPTNHGQDMMRVSVLSHQDTDTLRRQYPEHPEIKPFKGPHGLGYANNGRDEAKYTPGGGQTTGVVTTWEVVLEDVETVVDRTTIDGDGYPQRRVLRVPERRRTMVKTVIAGDVLLSVRTWTESEATTRLPVVPFYLLENVNHPYGYALPMRLKRSQDFINKVRLLVYEQGVRSFSNQAIGVLMKNLGAKDDLASLERKAREGGLVAIEGNDDDGVAPITDIRQMFMPLAAATASVTPALIELLRLEMENFKASAEMVDQQAMMRARTGFAKQQEQESADRPKTMMLAQQSRSAEAFEERVAAHWRSVRERHAIPTRSGYVQVNERVRERVRKYAPDGTPIASPLVATPDNPQGLLYEEVEGVFGSTRAAVVASAESRTARPEEMIKRLGAYMALSDAEQGAGLIVQKTLRDRVLTDDIRAEDDRNRQEAAEEAEAAQAFEARQAGLTGFLGAPAAAEGDMDAVGQQLGAALAMASPEIAGMGGSEVAGRLANIGFNDDLIY